MFAKYVLVMGFVEQLASIPSIVEDVGGVANTRKAPVPIAFSNISVPTLAFCNVRMVSEQCPLFVLSGFGCHSNIRMVRMERDEVLILEWLLGEAVVRFP